MLSSHHTGNLRSIYAMLIAVFMFSLMDTAMKLLAAHYPSMQVAALRSLSSLPLVCAYVAWRGGFGTMLRVRWSLHLLRGGLGIGMLSLFAFGLKKLSLAEAYSIFFIAPALITAMSVFFLKETVNLARWIAIFVGLGGVLVVLRPEGEGMLTLGGMAILGSAVCYAISAIAARVQARSDSTRQMMFWLMLLMSIGATTLAAPNWVALDPAHVWLLVGLAISGFFGQLAITEAFSHGEASVVAPFEYSALAWGVAIDWLLWQALPDQYTLIGAAIIIGSGIYLIRHEKTHAESEHP
jgi:drug/metabolite transporter (DMT)-like permease